MSQNDLVLPHTVPRPPPTPTSSKFDVNLLRCDVSAAKQRLERLKSELKEINYEFHARERGVQSLRLDVCTPSFGYFGDVGVLLGGCVWVWVLVFVCT